MLFAKDKELLLTFPYFSVKLNSNQPLQTMTLPVPSHKAIRLSIIWIVAIAVLCLQYVGLASQEPDLKRIFVIVGWIPYLYVIAIAIQTIRSKGFQDKDANALCMIASLFIGFIATFLNQSSFLSSSTLEYWNNILGIDVYMTAFVTIGAITLPEDSDV